MTIIVLNIIFLLGIIISTIIVYLKYIRNYINIPFYWRLIGIGCGFGFGLTVDSLINLFS